MPVRKSTSVTQRIVMNRGNVSRSRISSTTTRTFQKTGKQQTQTGLDWANRLTMIGITIFTVSVGSVSFQYTEEELKAFMPNYGERNTFTEIEDPLDHYDYKPYGEQVFDTIVGYITVLGGFGQWAKNYYEQVINFVTFSTGNYDPGTVVFPDEFTETRWAEIVTYSKLGQNTNYDVYLYLTEAEREYILDNYNDPMWAAVEIEVFYSKRYEFLFIDPVTGDWYWFYDSPSVYDWIDELGVED